MAGQAQTTVVEQAGPSGRRPQNASSEAQEVNPPIGDGDPAPVDERVEDLKLKVRLFLATFSQHSPRTDLVQRVLSSLNLEAADAAKLSKITQLIDNLNQPQIRQSFKTPAKAGNELVKIMKAWDDCRDYPAIPLPNKGEQSWSQ